MDDILDIIHNIGFNVEASQLDNLTTTLRTQVTEIGRLTQRNAEYARTLRRMTLDETEGRARILAEMRTNQRAIDERRRSLENLILTDRRFNDQLIREQGLIGALTERLRILQRQRTAATSESEVRRYGNLIQREQERLNRLNRPTDRLPGMNGLLNTLGPISKLLPAVGGALSIGAIGSQIFDVTKKFEGYNTTLKSSYGSSVQAQGAFDKIQKFAKETPFSVDELTGSFIKLKNRGFDPTTSELISIGDLASSQGKGFDQLTEAILDAQTGEFERLKEFGIKAKTVGDTVTLSFKGIEKQVKKTDQEALRNAVISFGQMAGVTGQMAAQSKTLDGQLSNLGDTWDMVFDAIGKKGSPEIKQLIGLVNELSGEFLDLVKNSPADDLRDQQNEVNGLIAGIATLNNFEGQRSELISELTAKYPELIKGIDLEKISSSELLAVLDGINRGYEKRIQLAETVSIKEKAQAKAKSAMDKAADIVTDASLQERLKEVDKSLKSNYAKMFNEAQGYRAKAEVLYKAQAEMMDKKWTIPTVGLKSFNWLANDLIENTNEAQNQRNNATNATSTESKQNAALKKRYEELKKTLKTRSEYIANLQKLDKEGKLGDQKYHLTNADREQGEFLNLEMQFGETKKDSPNKSSETPKKKKKEKTPEEIALDKIKEAEEKAIAEEQKRNAEYIKLQNTKYSQLEINAVQFQKRLERNESLHQQKLLSIQINFSRQKIPYQKGADKSQSQASISTAQASLSTIALKTKDDAEKEIKLAIETFNSLNSDLFDLRDESDQKELQRMQDQHQKKLALIDKQMKEETDKLKDAEDTKNVELTAKIIDNIRLLSMKKAAQEKKNDDEESDKKFEFFKEKVEAQAEQQKEAIDAWTENQKAEFGIKEEQNRKQNEAEIDRLKESGNNKEELARKQALAFLYIEYETQSKLLARMVADGKSTNDELKKHQKKVDDAAKKADDANNDKKKKTGLSEETKAYFELGNTAVETAQTIISAFEGQVDKEIELREKCVSRAQEIADRGNAEALQLEEKRLDKAQKTKEKFAKQQVAVNLIMQASATALAIAEAAAASGGIGAPAGIAIVLAALAAGFVAVKGFTADTPAFKDGVIGFNGKGTGTSDSNIVRISNGESVITAKGTMENREILEEINKGKIFKTPNFQVMTAKLEAIRSPSDSDIKNDLKNIEKAIKEIKLVQNESKIEFDRRGILAITQELQIVDRKRQNL